MATTVLERMYIPANDIEVRYFEWLCAALGPRAMRYQRLLSLLHHTPFSYTMAMDANRFDDGVNLRYRFGDECSSQHLVANHLDATDCSVLEMMVALALRCEEHVMTDPVKGDRTGRWFFTMLESMGLLGMTDSRIDIRTARRIVDGMLNRRYSKTGEGGLFTIDNPNTDMRTVEIWYQLCAYLDQYF